MSRFVPYVNISAHLDDKPDQKVFSRYGLRGFPTVLLLDHDGGVLHGKKDFFRPSSKGALDRALAQVQDLFVLRAEVAKSNPRSPEGARGRADLSLLEGLLKPGSADIEAMEKASQVPGVNGDLVSRFGKLRSRLAFVPLFENYKRDYEGRTNLTERRKVRSQAKKDTYDLLVGKLAIDDSKDELFHAYWVLAFGGAIDARDLERATLALDTYVRAYGANSRSGKLIRQMRKQHEELQKSLAGSSP